MSSEPVISATMKAVVVHQTGTADTALTFEPSHPTPTLQPNHILVKNTYAGLNFIDTYHRTGLYPRTVPFILGQEGAGVVVSLSPEAQADAGGTSLKVGDRVVYGAFGSYAEYTSVPMDVVIPIPEGVTTEEAVICNVQGLTGHYLTTSAHAGLITEGEWMLIYSVGSGTGQWAAQMAKLRGYKVIGTCSKGKEPIAREAGCDELIVLDEVEGKSYANYESVDIPNRVMDITGGQGVKCILDGIGKSTAEISLTCLAKRGIFVSFGNASGPVPAFPLLKLVGKSAFVTRPKLNDYVGTREELLGRFEEVFGWLKEKKLKVKVDKVLKLEDVKEGHVYLESGKSGGKILYKME